MELRYFDTEQNPLMTFKSYDYSAPLNIPRLGSHVKLIDKSQIIEGDVTDINYTYAKMGVMSVHVMIKVEDD